jgi:ribulose-bisphosphate carboxylase large chain
LREAWVAAIEGVPLEQQAQRNPALQAALGFW